MTSSLEDLSWFETLNLPLFANPKLIELNSQGWKTTGFLLRETEFSFDMQSLSLEITHVVKHPQGTEWIEKSQFDTQLALKDSLWASLPEEIQRQILERSATYRDVPGGLSLVCKAWFLRIHRGDGFATGCTSQSSYSVCDVRSTIEAAIGAKKDSFSRHDEESFVLAWLAHKHGMVDEARTLMQKPKAHIKTLIPVRLLWVIVLEMGRLDVPFEKLLEELKILEPFYPRTDHHYAELREYITALETMMIEAKEHDERMKGKIFAELSEDEQIDELIYQLRTQNGHQMCQPGACDLLYDRRKKNPLKQLIKRGYPVIPKLIPHLEDRTLTRSVGYHRNFYFSHHVLRVGDCCLRAVTEITNRSFYERTTTNSYASSENQLTSIKAQCEQWWHEFNSKGKKQMSIEQILRFGYSEAEQTTREFVKEFPEDVVALFTTVFDGRECPVAGNLFEILAEFEPQSPEILALLHKEFQFRPSFEKALVCPRIKNFDMTEVNAFVLKTYPLCLDDARRDDFEKAVDYITNMNLKEGVQLMIDTVPNMENTYMVRKVCEAIVRGTPVSWGSRLRKLAHPKESFEIVYSCLRNTTRTSSPELRLCDEIAKLMSQQNKEHRFSAFTSEANRDRQIAKILFDLHQTNGEANEPMDVEPLPNSDEIPLTQVYSLLCKYIEAKRSGDAKLVALESDIKGYGFKIIPAIDQCIAQLRNDDEKHVLRALARQLAFRVQDVTVIGATTASLDALLAPLRQMHEFNYEVVAQLARSMALAKYAYYIQYSRFKDQLGVNLRVEIGKNEMSTNIYVNTTLVYNGDERKNTAYPPMRSLTAEQVNEFTTLIQSFSHRTPFVGYFHFHR